MSTATQSPKRPSVSIDFSKSYDTASLKGKSALVTGGATGIGQGCVVSLAEAGAYVTIADVNEKDASETVDSLTQKGHHVNFVKTDVTSWRSLVEAFKSAVNFCPDKTLDIMIPAAGVGGIRLIDWLDDPKVDEGGDPKPVTHTVLDVNLDGVFNSAHLALYYFKKFPGSKLSDKQIIFVSSMAGYAAMTGMSGYNASKWGVRGLFKSLRDMETTVLGEGKPKFRTNLIAPGFIRTPMTKGYWALAESGQMRMGTVGDVVDVVLRVCVDEDIIGRAVSINAGATFDLGDDLEGKDAGEILTKLRRERKAPPKEPNWNKGDEPATVES